MNNEKLPRSQEGENSYMKWEVRPPAEGTGERDKISLRSVN